MHQDAGSEEVVPAPSDPLLEDMGRHLDTSVTLTAADNRRRTRTFSHDPSNTLFDLITKMIATIGSSCRLWSADDHHLLADSLFASSCHQFAADRRFPADGCAEHERSLCFVLQRSECRLPGRPDPGSGSRTVEIASEDRLTCHPHRRNQSTMADAGLHVGRNASVLVDIQFRSDGHVDSHRRSSSRRTLSGALNLPMFTIRII